MKSVFCFIFMLTLTSAVHAQPTKDFEGTITYRYAKFNSEGLSVSFPQELEELHVSSTKMMVKVISGQIKYALGYDLLLDIDKNERYQVFEKEKKLIPLPRETTQHLNLAKEETLPSQKILNRDCRKISLERLHNHAQDTVTYFYYFNHDLQSTNLKEFAALQGNQNTLFLDGRYGLIPLKVELNYPDHSRIVIEAIDIRTALSPKTFDFSSYTKASSQ